MQTRSLYVSVGRHHDDFFSRSCSSREASSNIINLSFEDYHGGTSVAVPFNWESEPGTPKVKSRDRDREIPTLPPLTPPPSYFYSTPKSKRTPKNHSSKPKLLGTLFAKRSSSSSKPRDQLSPASYSSSSSSSSSSSRSSSPWPRSYSVPASPMRASNLCAQNELSRARFCDSRADEEDHEYESSVSTPCFGRGPSSTRRPGFCSTMLKVLLLRDDQ